MPEVPMIAVVDDDEAVRTATQRLIRSLGYRVSAFSSAEAFLISDRMQDAACLITDVHMPGLNGVELQDRLIAQGHRIPIIFITAFPDDRMRERAMKSGAVCFMSKPCSDENLIGYLDQALKAA